MNMSKHSETNLLSQDQLANRYGLEQGTVSAILRRYDVLPCGHYICPITHRTKRQYDEKEAVYAFKQYYRDKADGLRDKARAFDDIAEAFVAAYEKNYLLDHMNG